MYVKVKNNIARYCGVEDLRLEHPNVSFPAVITDDIAAEFGVFRCAFVDPPVIDHTKNITVGPPVLKDGKWSQTWDVTDAAPEEVQQRIADQWAGIRVERNMRLTGSDWTQLSDAPVDRVEWAKYRQALRDITNQTDPFNIVWPEEPTA